MRRILTPHLPTTANLTDANTIEFLAKLNNELDNFRRDINRYVGTESVTTLTEAQTVAVDNDVMLCNGTFTVTLPTVTGLNGRFYTIKNIGSGTITIACNGTETIDGATTQSLASQYDFKRVITDGSAWYITGE
jgi:hypothetical protein